MHLYLAVGMLGGISLRRVYHLVRPIISKPLLTFAYPNTLPTLEMHITGAEPVRVLIDSGAFTIWTGGGIAVPEAYADWALAAQRQWEPRVEVDGIL